MWNLNETSTNFALLVIYSIIQNLHFILPGLIFLFWSANELTKVILVILEHLQLWFPKVAQLLLHQNRSQPTLTL